MPLVRNGAGAGNRGLPLLQGARVVSSHRGECNTCGSLTAYLFGRMGEPRVRPSCLG